MSQSFYDKYGGNPSYVSVSYDHPDINTIKSSVDFKTDLGGNPTHTRRDIPNFKTLFEDYKLHNPQEHRAYLFDPKTAPTSKPIFDNAEDGRAIWYKPNSLQPFNKTKTEFQTVVKDGKEYLAPSVDFVNYLKQQDELFVLSVVELQMSRNLAQREYDNMQDQSDYYKDRVKKFPTAINAYNAKINDVNNQFKTFVADMCRSLIELNKPFYASVGGVDYDVPVSIGNFSAYELDKFVNSVFGNVTGDDFIPEVNEEIYNAKTETSCCLKVCVSNELYRKEGVPYEESPQKVEDDAEFQKYLQSDEFTPYVPPPPYKQIGLEQYMGYLNEVQSFARSPLSYVFDKLKPYIEEGLANLKSGGYIDSYKIQGNDISIGFDWS